jgi:uncharacterized protein YcbK (DUF882 family)
MREQHGHISGMHMQFLKAGAPALLAGILAGSALAQDSSQEKSLSLTNLHTKESLTVIYKTGDFYIPQALERINHLLRDHRSHQTATINPKTLDRLHEIGETIKIVYPHVPVHFEIISGYRAPETNQALREKGGGQAQKSRHMTGDAIDMRVPGLTTKALRDIAWCTGSGGTGYYADDGFIHIDSGNRRFWPGTWSPQQVKCQDI